MGTDARSPAQPPDGRDDGPAIGGADRRGAGLGLLEGTAVLGLSWPELWVRYLSVGGLVTLVELEAYVAGLLLPDAHEHDLIAQALNDRSTELPWGRDYPVAYYDAPEPGSWPPAQPTEG